MSPRLVLLFTAIAFVPGPARAQLFSYDREAPRPTQAVAFAYVPVDFNYTGGGEPVDRFDFDDVVYGLQYTRPGLQIAVLLGNHRPAGATAEEDLQLIDASLFTWGEIGLTRELSGGANRIFIPIALHSGHRRVAVEDEAETAIDAFSVTVIGIGSGLGLNLERGKVQVVARAIPAIGIATRSFGDATGSSTLFDGDLSLHVGPIVGRFGLHFGYAYRSQRWNVGSSELLEDVAEDYFDYAGSHHLVRAGISF
jgi:hypothetical protein